MGRKSLSLFLLISLGICKAAAAATFTVEVNDADAHPVANAVVMLVPESRSAPAASTRLATEKSIDQRNETFIPLVTIIPKGGHIVFANNDSTTHQVYSFSPVKQFEITLARGEKSAPIGFENPGIAALGCNIHDHMIAYTFVADSPWTALTGADGRAVIADVPPGSYEAQLWHPKLPQGRPAPTSRISVSTDTVRASFTVKVLSTPTVSRGHSANY